MVCTVSTVKNSVDALSALRVQQHVDLVVTDLHMPGMDGIQLQKQIDEEFNLPVVSKCKYFVIQINFL